MNHPHKIKKFVLLLGDLAVLYLSLWLTLAIRYQSLPDSERWLSHVRPFSFIFILWVIIFYIANLYDLRQISNSIAFWQRSLRSLLIAGAGAAIFFYILPDRNISPKTTLAIYLIVFALVFAFWRQFYHRALAAYLPKISIGIIGYNEQIKEIIQEVSSRSQLGYRLSFIIDENADTDINHEGQTIFSKHTNLAKLAAEQHPNIIVFTTTPHESIELRRSLFALLPQKINFISLVHFYESLTGKVPISAIGETWFLENLSEGSKGFFDQLKRFFDFTFALVFIIISSLLWPIIAIVIKLTDNGAVFFSQTRLGQNGEAFTIYKFRTMRTAKNDFAPTGQNDNRITPFGNFLRKSRLDEIPQLINIIKGEMSFVGPRPERPELIKDLEQLVPFYQQRMLVKPGISGWDQVSGEYHSPSYEDTMKKLQYDLFYIKNRSYYLDLSIILKTIYTVLSRTGL
ncbi:MAG: sugar transferase [Candidatus Falkowbacteria bacterium]